MKLKRNIAALALALFFAIPAAAQEKKSSEPPAVPKLALESFSHDFGEVKAGTPLKFTFKIKNAGKSELLIKSVNPGWGCTASDYDRVVPPGQEGKITLAIEHTESYQGEVAKSANVTTNDPVYSSFALTLRGYFKADRPPVGSSSQPAMASRRAGPFTMLPNDRWITSVLSGTSTSTRMSLFNPETKPVHIKKVTAGGTNFNVSLQTIEDGKRYELAVATNPALKPGHYEQTVQVSTDSAQSPEATVQLEVTVFARVFVRPTAINVQPLSLDSDLSAVNLPLIYVEKLREGGLKINSINSTLPFIKLEVATQKEGESYSIRIKIDKSLIPGVGRFSGIIRIATNDSDVSTVEVPIQVAFN